MRALLGVALLCCGLAVAAPTLAVDLVNADDRPHRLQVVEWGEAHEFVIAPGMTLSDVCLVCTVKMAEGTGAVVAEDNDIVVIRQGTPQVGG